MSEVVKVEREGSVAVVSLNRPDKLNACSPDVFSGLREAGREVAADHDVRAVLLRGEGRAFCAGLDLSSLQQMGGSGGSGDGGGQPVTPATIERGFGGGQEGFAIWGQMGKPVVSAVQGYALGAGFQLAIAADLVVAAEDAVMSVFEITYGLVPDLGGTWRLPRLVGPARAKELIWTARRFSAAEAEQWGIVNKVVPVDQLMKEAMVVAQDLASRPPLPIRYAKELVDRSGRVTFEEGLAGEREAQIKCLTSNDIREAVAAAFEKREGKYSGT